MQDKTKATLLVIEATIKDAKTQELYAKTTSTIMIRGIGGFGHKGTFQIKFPEIPSRAPDAVSEEKT